MRYLSMFSGIEAASVAWEPLGWECAAVCEIEKFPSAVLAHHYPHVANLGDVTKANFNEIGPIDLAVFGSPCQSFSIAGKRLGLDDARGNLALLAGSVVYRKRPDWFVFENVPGLLSSDSGWDFGTLLAAYSGHPSGSVFTPPEGGWGSSGVVQQADENSYGLAWRILDAQYFGVPQRRRRVFVVGHLGDWRRAAAVLFERQSLRGDPAPSREKGPCVAALTANGVGTCGADDNQGQAGHLIAMAHGQGGAEVSEDGGAPSLTCNHEAPIIAHSLRGEGFDASKDGTGRGTPLVPVAIQERAVSDNPDAGPDGKGWRDDGMAYTLEARSTVQAVAFAQNTRDEVRLQGGDGQISGALAADEGMKQRTYIAQAVAYDLRGREGDAQFEGPHDTANLRAASGGSSRSYVQQSAVRRLTPEECEKLQGFPPGYTAIPWRGKGAADCPDGPRYKALGNSFAVPVMRWIGERIDMVRKL